MDFQNTVVALSRIASGLLIKAVVGLGNPGSEYAETRHNIGFMVIEEVARRNQSGAGNRRFRALIREYRDAQRNKIVLASPQTYMNLSGQSVRELIGWYRLEPADLLVVSDDLNLPFGTLRLRMGGSSGGHNGLVSIAESIGTEGFPRLRVGIGRSSSSSRAHVLSRFSPEEKTELPKIITSGADAVELWLTEGIIAAMNIVNRPADPPTASPQELTNDG